MTHPDEIERLKRLYTYNYPPSGEDISYTWHPRNPISIYYRQAQERAIVSLFNSLDLTLKDTKVLDIGCGSGNLLRFFASLGADPSHLYGIDLIPQRIYNARVRSPVVINYSVGNAENLPFQDASVDLSCLFTVFSSILDHDLRARIAQEVTRIIKDSGYLLWYDMCYTKSIHTRAIREREIETLFPALEPVVRMKIHSAWISKLAKHSFFICDIIDHMPFLRRTHNLVLLKKSSI
jgi:ubiquinone/menaquinone biosynthesis C-methylase UbiE